MPTGVKEETYEITQVETDIVATDVEPGDDKDEWDNLWRVQVPVGLSYVIRPEDFFSLYLYDLAEYVEGAVAADATAYTNETVDARDVGTNDMTLLPAVGGPIQVNDAYYFGSRHPFTKLTITATTAGVGVWVITWEYYNGSTWATLPGISDGSAAAGAGFTAAAGDWDITFTLPPDWAKYAGAEVIGQSLYWIRARVSAYTSAATQPKGDYAYVNSALEHLAVDMIKIETRDASEEGRALLLAPCQYSQVKEFQDVDKFTHFDIAEPAIVPEGHWIAIMGKSTAGVMDVSASYFKLSCKRVRHTLFE